MLASLLNTFIKMFTVQKHLNSAVKVDPFWVWLISVSIVSFRLIYIVLN